MYYQDKLAKEMKHEYTDEVVCPYCFHEHSDSWEFNDWVEGYECHECEKPFNVTRNVTINYSTSKYKENK